jgi:alpha-tubulin suppressor-like RCC1 family protein
MTKTLSCSTSTPEAIAGARSVANGTVLLTAILSLAALSPDLARAQAGELFPLYAQVSAGYDHTCAVTTTGGVKCWGGNAYGELGNGTTINSIPVVDVSGLTGGVSAVSSGDGHSCALASNGAMKCWGNNQFGELGNGSSIASSTPVDVSGMSSGIAAISTGGFHSCALTTNGGVKCWGDNTYGQLGNNTTIASNTPVDVSGLTSGVAAISAGANHTCALTTGGGVKCWGSNSDGQLGNGSNTNSNIPVDVTGLTSGVAAVSAGSDHTCALTTLGGVKCWGSDASGQLGDGTNTDSTLAVDVFGLTSGVAAVSVGTDYSCAILTAGGVKCWGFNGDGELGNGNLTDTNTPSTTIGFTVTRTHLKVGKTTVTQGSMLTFSVKVQTTGSKPHGTAEIYVDDNFAGSGTLVKGRLVVKLTMSQSMGSHTVRAAYDGLGSLSSSISAAIPITIS